MPLASVVIALGSNLGDRHYQILRAVASLSRVVRLVRLSRIRETAPVDAPVGSPDFLNAVLVGFTSLSPQQLMQELLAIERRQGRERGAVSNAPRIIDLDLIVHGGHRLATRDLVLPHPRARGRAFVMEPLQELGLAHLLR